ALQRGRGALGAAVLLPRGADRDLSASVPQGAGGLMAAATIRGRFSITLPVLAAFLVIVSLFPFAWMLLSSIKTLRELYPVPPSWIPETPTLANYMKVLFESNVPRYFLNSCVIAGGATLLALALAIPAAYGFARFNFRGKRFWQASILAGQMLPTA